MRFAAQTGMNRRMDQVHEHNRRAWDERVAARAAYIDTATEKDFQKPLAVADPFTKDRIVAVLELGSRGAELLALTWADVLDDHVVLTTRKTRSREPKQRKVTISPTLR